MPGPQLENGYTKIANELLEALCRIRIAGEQRQCLDVIIRKTYGFNKKSDCIALSQFALMTGLKKPHISRALKGLCDKKIILTKKDNGIIINYRINKDYSSWNPLPKKKTLIGSSTVTLDDIKSDIRKRDSNSCFMCGYKGGKKSLSVHHIDYNQGNNDPSNLITLCPSCHGKTNSNYDYWKEELSKKVKEYLLPKKVISVTKKGKKPLPKTVHTKETNTKENIVEIISFLNKTTNSNFRHTTQNTISKINARLKDGFSIQDFKDVISFKNSQWHNDPKNCQYLRPETLFGTKMEGYLEASKKVVSFKSQKQGYDYTR